MDSDRIMRAVFIPDGTMPPAVTPTPPVPPIPEPPLPPPPPNYDPIADFNISNPTPVEGQSISLIDCSTHPGAANGESIVSYQWTIQGKSGSTEPNVSVNWGTTGTYQITLRVEDQDGDSDSCTKSVVVGPAMPAAVININPTNVVMGRKMTIDGDESTAAGGRTIKWDAMSWELKKPDGTIFNSSARYPVPDRAAVESIINQTGVWTVRLKVKDSSNNESEWAESYFTVYPDKAPIADFWVPNESLRNSYDNHKVTVQDLSIPASPDASLGDEITSRVWKLYYDSNNDGDYIDAADKQIMVINIAPTVAFEIKKKTPVDVQFAADYTVSDSKYNSLKSSIAGFTGTLASSYIAPVIGYQKVKEGDIAESLSGYNPRVITGNMWYQPPVIRHFAESATPGIYNFDTSELFTYNDTWSDYARHVDINTGSIGDGSQAASSSKVTYKIWEDGSDPEAPVEGYTFDEQYRIVARPGLLQVYKGTSLVSSASDMPVSNYKNYYGIYNRLSPCRADYPIGIVSFDTNKTVVLYQNVMFSSAYNYSSSLILYDINNNTGAISAKKEFTGLFSTGFNLRRFSVDSTRIE
ncbi:MAG: PKD domain-containing protein [Parabacteroides sp.]|nr:PKD domain-containing protein [Parabacteroides sp.]